MNETNLQTNVFTFPWIIFKLGEDTYSINSKNVLSISSFDKIIKIPDEPEFVRGIIKFRGEVVPMIDLKNLLNITTLQKKEMAIILQGNNSWVGIIVDEIEGIDELSIMQSNISSMTNSKTNHIMGVAQRKDDDSLILLIDENTLLFISDETKDKISNYKKMLN